MSAPIKAVGMSAPAPPVLLPFQQAWVAEKKEVAVWRKSRRVGASWCTGSLAVLTAGAENGEDVLYIGYSEDMTQEFIEDCGMWSRAFAKAAFEVGEFLFDDTDESGETRHIKAFKITYPSGKKILALSSRPRSIRGKQGLVVIDEAAFHDDLEGLITAALALLIWGGRVLILSSENGAENPFHQLVDDIKAGKLDYALHEVTFRQAVAEGLAKRVFLKMGWRWSPEAEAEWVVKIYALYKGRSDEELDCIPRNSAGYWLSRQLIESCMEPDIPIVRWEPPEAGFVMWSDRLREAEVKDWCDRVLLPILKGLDEKRKHIVGGDFGRLADLTSFAVGSIEQDLALRTRLLVELRDMPFEQQKQVFYYIGERLPRFVAAKLDARGNGHYLAEVAMQKFGSRVEGVMTSEGWYRDNTVPFKTAFQDRVIVLPKDDDVLDDLRLFEVVRGVARMPEARNTGKDGKQRHGDSGIAFLMMHAASRAEFVPMEFQSAGGSRPDSRMDGFRL